MTHYVLVAAASVLSIVALVGASHRYPDILLQNLVNKRLHKTQLRHEPIVKMSSPNRWRILIAKTEQREGLTRHNESDKTTLQEMIRNKLMASSTTVTPPTSKGPVTTTLKTRKFLKDDDNPWNVFLTKHYGTDVEKSWGSASVENWKPYTPEDKVNLKTTPTPSRILEKTTTKTRTNKILRDDEPWTVFLTKHEDNKRNWEVNLQNWKPHNPSGDATSSLAVSSKIFDKAISKTMKFLKDDKPWALFLTNHVEKQENPEGVNLTNSHNTSRDIKSELVSPKLEPVGPVRSQKLDVDKIKPKTVKFHKHYDKPWNIFLTKHYLGEANNLTALNLENERPHNSSSYVLPKTTTPSPLVKTVPPPSVDKSISKTIVFLRDTPWKVFLTKHVDQQGNFKSVNFKLETS